MHNLINSSHSSAGPQNEVSFVANCISTSFGGAVLGGASGSMQWALAGGLFGVAVAIWSAVVQRRRKNLL